MRSTSGATRGRAWRRLPLGMRLPAADLRGRVWHCSTRGLDADQLAARRRASLWGGGPGRVVDSRSARRPRRPAGGRADPGGGLLRAAHPRARALPLPRARAGGPAGGSDLEMGGALWRADPLVLRKRVLALHHRLFVRRRRLPDEPGPLQAADASRPGTGVPGVQRRGNLPAFAHDRDRPGLAPDTCGCDEPGGPRAGGGGIGRDPGRAAPPAAGRHPRGAAGATTVAPPHLAASRSLPRR